MAYLVPDKIIVAEIAGEKFEIKQRIIPNTARAQKDIASWIKTGNPVKPCRKLNNGTGTPKGITIHNTNDISVPAATNPAEQYSRATYPNGNMAGTVVHFFVHHGEVWQNLAENEQGWHATDSGKKRASHRAGETISGNDDTIGIECIGASSESEKTTAMLTAYLLKKHGLSAETDIYTHKDFHPSSGCPVFILSHWDSFTAQVKKYFGGSVSTTEPAKTEKTIEELAQEVMAGKWGNGEERKTRLTAAGHDCSAIQKRVNEILAGKTASAPQPATSKSIEELAQEVMAGKWKNNPERKKLLTAAGYDAVAVQKRVNEILKGK